MIANGIHARDAQAIGSQAARTGAAPGTDGDIDAARIPDKVIDNEIIIDVSHLFNDGLLIGQPFPHVLRRVSPIAAVQTFLAQAVKIRAVVLPARRFELRELRLAEFQLHLAAPGDLPRIVDGFRHIRKQGAHLLLRFIVEFLGIKREAVFFLYRVVRLDTEQDAVHLAVFPRNIMTIVRRHKGNIQFAGKADELRVHIFLLAQAMVLQLQIEIPLAENFLIAHSGRLRFLVIVCKKRARDLPRQTGGERNQPFMVLPEQLEIHTRLAVEAFQPGARDKLRQIPVALVVLAEQNQVAVFAIQLMDFVEPGALRHIDLTANNRPDAPFLCLFIKLHRTVHHTVIGDGDCFVPTRLRHIQQPLDPARTVQQAVFRVQMKMGKHEKSLLL